MKKFQSLADPISFFEELGDLHDAKICRVEWILIDRVIVLEVDNLNANFVGLPEYQGRKQALIKFNEVESVQLDCDAVKVDVQRVYELEVGDDRTANRRKIALRITPSGQLSFFCASIEIGSLLEGGQTCKPMPPAI